MNPQEPSTTAVPPGPTITPSGAVMQPSTQPAGGVGPESTGVGAQHAVPSTGGGYAAAHPAVIADPLSQTPVIEPPSTTAAVEHPAGQQAPNALENQQPQAAQSAGLGHVAPFGEPVGAAAGPPTVPPSSAPKDGTTVPSSPAGDATALAALRAEVARLEAEQVQRDAVDAAPMTASIELANQRAAEAAKVDHVRPTPVATSAVPAVVPAGVAGVVIAPISERQPGGAPVTSTGVALRPSAHTPGTQAPSTVPPPALSAPAYGTGTSAAPLPELTHVEGAPRVVRS